jgi:Holliday junction resolvase
MTEIDLASAYAEHGSIWKVATMAGICAETVRKRLNRAGIATNGSGQPWTDADTLRLSVEYQAFANAGRLDDLAKAMGRTKQYICRKARECGLTNKKRERPYISTWKHISDEAASAIWGHFKASRLNLSRYCARYRYDDLGFSRHMQRQFADEYDHVIELKAPRAGRYAAGRRFEYRVRDALKASGYFVVRSPQSKSPVDLTAIRTGSILLVQCKAGIGYSVPEWNALFELAQSVSATPVFATLDEQRNLALYEMTDRKDGSKRRQPMRSIDVTVMTCRPKTPTV